MSACRSQKPSTRSGLSSTMRSILALVKAATLGFSHRARGGRTVKPEMPTIRSWSPSTYSVSVVSSVRQTMRRGPSSTLALMFPIWRLTAGGLLHDVSGSFEQAGREYYTCRPDLAPEPLCQRTARDLVAFVRLAGLRYWR